MADFGGFKSLSANFTLTPNQFFDRIVGHYQPCVVSVVAILIRSTLGWEDPDTGDRRVEAELPMTAFIRPELSENSVRRGLAGAVEAGFVVQTVPSGPRQTARYALRWEDADAQERAIRKQRAAELEGEKGDGNDAGSRGANLGPPKKGPLNLRPPKSAPPYSRESKKDSSGKEKKSPKESTFNVGEGLSCAGGGGEVAHSQGVFSRVFEAEAAAIASELQDLGSERRHKQLLSMCEQHGLSELPGQALQATRRRLAKEGRRGILEKPGAYYQSVLIKLLEGHQVFVPTAGEDDTEEVRLLARQSLGLEE